MSQNRLSSEFVGNEIVWCLDKGLLPNTRYTVGGIQRNNVYSKEELESIFSNLLDQLLESNGFRAELKKTVNFAVSLQSVKKEALRESNINESLEDTLESMRLKGVSGVDLFHSLMCDVLEILDFKEEALEEVVESGFEDTLLKIWEYKAFTIFKALVNRILNNAIKRLEFGNKCTLKIEDEWTDDFVVDHELLNLLNYGSISGIYNRIRLILTMNRQGQEGCEDRNSTGFNIVKATLMCELERLTDSRQAVFTRVVNYLVKLINIDDEHLYSYLVVKEESNLNRLMWKVIYEVVVESGIRRLYYDEFGLVKGLHKMKVKGVNVSRFFKILTYKESFEGNAEDHERMKSEVLGHKYFEQRDLGCRESGIPKLVFDKKGVNPFESSFYI